MATSPQGFIAAAAPTRTVRVSYTTLFEVAMRHFGDALRWVEIAEANGLTDPWIGAQTTLTIPNVVPSTTPTGILGQ
jgi:hypothetical protein